MSFGLFAQELGSDRPSPMRIASMRKRTMCVFFGRDKRKLTRLAVVFEAISWVVEMLPSLGAVIPQIMASHLLFAESECRFGTCPAIQKGFMHMVRAMESSASVVGSVTETDYLESGKKYQA